MSEKIKQFEDLIAWQKARRLTALVYELTARGRFAADFGLRDQIRLAAVSIMSNIAEGFERDTPNEFYRFLSIAKASCAEVRSQLYIALDAGYIEQACFSDARARTEEVGRILGGLRASVNRKRNSGPSKDASHKQNP